MSRSSLRLRGSLFSVLLVSLLWLGCADSRDVTAPDDLGPNIRVVDQVALSHAIRVQEAHTDEMFEIAGVVGTGVGLTADGQLAVKIFTTEAGVAGLLPESLEDVPVAVEVTGMIFAQRAAVDPTAEFTRPVPIGVSTGHPSITAGTIGARVKDASGSVYALSNNHIYADQNDASIGDAAIQPGTFDGGSSPADDIGTLFDFEPIKFAIRRSAPPNTMDAAIVLSSTAMLSDTTPDGGYGAPSSSTVTAFVNQKVQKYGRTTGLSHGTVDAVNVTVNVCYEGFGRCTKLARFTKQIVITPGSFSGGGDSGSLIVTDDGNNNPVGLLFAGSSTHTIANRIDLILDRFNVTIDGAAATPVTDVAVTAVSAATASAVQGDVVSVDVTVENVGNQNVGSFDVTLEDLTDVVAIGGSQTVTSLTAGASATLTFSWNTTGASLVSHTLEGSHDLTDDDIDNNAATTAVTVNELSVGTTPLVGACNPSGAARDDRLTISVTGSNFVNGATVSFGQQVQIRDVSFTSETQLDVQIRVNKKAPFGTRDVTVTNPDGQSGTMTECFTVN